MRRPLIVAILLAVAALLAAPVPAAGADSQRVDSATVDGMDIHVVLPAGYAGSARHYPVLYLLHPFNEDRDAWLENSDLLEFTAEENVIVVLPSAGNTAGLVVDGRDESCHGETQLMRGVIPYVEGRYRTLPGRAHRAIAGASSGAFSAMHLAARHPDAFVAAASLSGPPDVTLGASPLGELYFFGAERDAVYECGGNPVTGGLFGTPLADEVWVHNANPADLAPNFGGLSVYTGDGNGVPCDEQDLAELYRAGFTPITRRSSESFVAALDRAGVTNTADLRDCGLHGWRYFEEFLHAFWPQLQEAYGRPAPDRFDYRRADPAFAVWGWAFRADPARAAEFLDVRDASRAGVTLTGSGRQTVTTAGYFQPGQRVRIDDGTSGREVVANEAGRITVTVDLGPAHATQQYRDPVAEQAPGYFTTRTVRFDPAEAT
jgi:S-formylglutathione hydrolase FrmB